MKIPSLILKQLYTLGSLENTPDGVRFGLKNRLSDAILTEILAISIDDRAVPLKDMKGHALRRLRTDTGQAAQGLDQLFE